MDRTPEPNDADERDLVLGWLSYHRDAFASKCEGLDAAQLVTAGPAGTTMSLLGLMRHLTEMERVYATYALGGSPTGELEFVYGPYVDGGPEGDFDGLTPEHVEPSTAAWHAERDAADRTIASMSSMGTPGAGNRRSLRWNLVKLMQEYARHNGHADLIRQSIDGAIGE